jgi:hypothetical protein
MEGRDRREGAGNGVGLPNQRSSLDSCSIRWRRAGGSELNVVDYVRRECLVTVPDTST